MNIEKSKFHSMYVTLRADGQWHQTSLQSRASKPIWNEEFLMFMSGLEPLEITLIDQDKEGYDFFKG